MQDTMAREGVVMVMEDLEKERAYAGGRGRIRARSRHGIWSREVSKVE